MFTATAEFRDARGMQIPDTEHVVVDGRVFATEAADRGMGRYVDFLARLLISAGHRVTIAVPGPQFGPTALRAGLRLQTLELEDDPMSSTTRLNRFLGQCGATIYLDATPFLPPTRYDVHVCPVVAVLYDLIPMRFPGDYFPAPRGGPLDVYVNGLTRVRKADQVIAISEYVRRHALRYLGIPRERTVVIEPDLGQSYVDFALAPTPNMPVEANIVCIQGAHRSKNFPVAIQFLERLSIAAERDVEIIVPTPGQRTLVENVRSRDFSRVRVSDSLREDRKFALQVRAGTIAHLSLDEGYGIPLAEALYLYRPIICVDSAINRELISGWSDPAEAGVLLLDDPELNRESTLRAAADFASRRLPPAFALARRAVIDAMMARRGQAEAKVARAIEKSKIAFEAWHSCAGLGVVASTEIGSCGVSDYCHALLRSGSPRYAILLGTAPRELQLVPHLRLLPLALLDDVRDRSEGMLFNLAVSDSLTRGFDAIAERSEANDLLVIHDAGSYLPGLLLQAAAGGDRQVLLDRYLRHEPDDVRDLAIRWLDRPDEMTAHSDRVFLEIDKRFRSTWLRNFRGNLISHHIAFAHCDRDSADGVLALLSPKSEIRVRGLYAPMPIDARGSPGLGRLAGKMRWALGLGRQDLLVCCAGSVVRGKHLDVVARVVTRINARLRDHRVPGRISLMLAGRILDDALYAAMRAEFAAHDDVTGLVHIVESDEVRYDALLLASDVVIAFREQRRIQMSHSYVRALALGRPIVTNEGAGFDDSDAAALCSDEHLGEDLERHVLRILNHPSIRRTLAAASQSRYRMRHTVDAFFAQAKELSDVAAIV